MECSDIKHGLSMLAHKFATKTVEHLAEIHLTENQRYAQPLKLSVDVSLSNTSTH